ncbi:glycoside hydrolase family 3 C-terminal domain-containing protein [Robinsoniella sp. KNHs210]|uniref:glycoside hydrolase family 3 C-terminal domain-containing protein n=1 Tax=Robinsoniella sp. KNHs210 TaxID=1469950 RepID=UPI000486C7B0|nr:glycoside hydrolase family 3 C-terminal domain-containing protein [Robinsoniella sp. KNHs210]
MELNKIKKIVAQMTLEEKASLCSGLDFWHTKGVERLGVPSVMVSDGPHGLRKQEEETDHLGLNGSIKAVCFPAGCAMAASFSREAAAKLGETLGDECQAEGISTILGPAMNIKRSPLCGRNFEYYSEDPLLATEIGTAYVNAVQSRNVGTSPKHFMANNQEHHRMTSSSDMDERTAREVYLAAFEGMVKNAKPWTIMNSYNKLNGTYLCENKEILTEVLRKHWGFDGYVMTDWGAMNRRVEALKAGCNLEMPGGSCVTDAQIVKAVKDRELEEKVLDQSCEELLNIVFRYTENHKEGILFDREKDHEIARELAQECIVLLKNEEHILPLCKEKKVVFIGKYAETPRYQGGGSSHINSSKVDSALETVKAWAEVIYAKGYDDAEDIIDEAMLKEAVEVAKNAEAAVIFAGLPDSFESEGYDRKKLRMPECQNRLIAEVAKIQTNTIVVLHNGSPVEMPWITDVKAVVEAYLGGQAVGSAVADVLYGNVNPSGRLPETFPLRLQDTPCYLNYGGERDKVEYKEGVFVGYRYYESKEMPVLFPFGYGLSYTTFEYSNLTVEKDSIRESEGIKVTVDVTNSGNCIGKEVVQFYVGRKEGSIVRPVRELRAFDKIELNPGETKTVEFTLGNRAFAYWEMEIHDWFVESGTYEIQIGKSASEIVLSKEIHVKGEKVIPKVYTENSTFGEVMADPKGRAVLEALGKEMNVGESMAAIAGSEGGEGVISQEMIAAMMEGMPLRTILMFAPGVQPEMIEKLVEALNT